MIQRFAKQVLVVLSALLLVFAPVSSASTASNTVTVPLVLNIPESVSLSLSTNSLVLTNAAPSQSLTATVSWQIQSGHTSATLYSWFSALPTMTGGCGSGPCTISQSNFSTQFNGGASVVCNQSTFPGGPNIGVSTQDCGTFSFQNIGTDLNDSQGVTVTLTAAPSAFNQAVGTYAGGVFNLLVQII